MAVAWLMPEHANARAILPGHEFQPRNAASRVQPSLEFFFLAVFGAGLVLFFADFAGSF